jgi:anti-sigma factor RsiW
MTGPHLNDQQFADYLLENRIDAGAFRHLVDCPACREECARFTMLVSDFNQNTLKWSEFHVAGPVLQPSFPVKQTRPLIQWAMAACLLVAGVLLVMMAGRSARHERASNRAIPQELNSREQIANDNRVLTGVYQEINSPVTVPMQEYGFSSAGEQVQRSKANSRVE